MVDHAMTKRVDAGARRTGFVGVLGQTNVGKSTFLNAVMGEKLTITSAKPQTTRNQIRCILTNERAQIVFLDTPGLHRPRDRLSRYLLREAYRGLRGLDAILYLVEPWGQVSELDRQVFVRLRHEQCPVLLVVNKIDLAKGNALEETLLAYEATGLFVELIPISAVRGDGLTDVIDTLIPYLPEGALLFPDDVNSDQAEEFLIGELIREKAILLTRQEIPYSIAVRVKWLHERNDDLVEIQAEIVVERESQKGIIVGKGGSMVRQIGTLARSDIETFLRSRVFLDLIVKVQPDWTKDNDQIRQLTSQT